MTRRRRNTGLALALALVGAGLGAGCQLFGAGDTPSPPPPPAPAAERDRTFKLGDGDVVDIKVFGEPDLAGVYRVNATGQIDFPLIGAIGLVGRDPSAIGREIRDRLADGFLKNPQVTVFVREYNSQKVHVLGQVSKPGSFPYTPGLSIIQAITNAGGFTKLASSNRVGVTRVVEGRERKFVIPVGDIRDGAAPNFELEPGDIVFIPEAIF